VVNRPKSYRQKVREKRLRRYLGLLWRGRPLGKTRVYRGTQHKELICPDISWGSAWCGAMQFRLTFRGRRNYRSEPKVKLLRELARAWR
jgi:hypothetical protein